MPQSPIIIGLAKDFKLKSVSLLWLLSSLWSDFESVSEGRELSEVWLAIGVSLVRLRGVDAVEPFVGWTEMGVCVGSVSITLLSSSWLKSGAVIGGYSFLKGGGTKLPPLLVGKPCGKFNTGRRFGKPFRMDCTPGSWSNDGRNWEMFFTTFDIEGGERDPKPWYPPLSWLPNMFMNTSFLAVYRPSDTVIYIRKFSPAWKRISWINYHSKVRLNYH